MIDHEGGALKTEIRVFIKEIPESSLCHVRTQQKLAVQNLEGGSHPGHMGTVILTCSLQSYMP